MDEIQLQRQDVMESLLEFSQGMTDKHISSHENSSGIVNYYKRLFLSLWKTITGNATASGAGRGQ